MYSKATAGRQSQIPAQGTPELDVIESVPIAATAVDQEPPHVAAAQGYEVQARRTSTLPIQR